MPGPRSPAQLVDNQQAVARQVGDTYPAVVAFNDELVTETTVKTVRAYAAKKKFGSSTRSLTVRDGGRRR